LKPEALVDPANSLNYCTFRNGASGGSLLTLNNEQSFTMANAVFPANTWGGAYCGSMTVNSGSVIFPLWGGAFGGQTHEHDTYNRIQWSGSGIQPMIRFSPHIS
jgi:hypothetical protein